MTSFGWKKKIGQTVVKRVRVDFEQDAKDEAEEYESIIQSGELDWLTLTSKRKCATAIPLEDASVKAGRLKAEGVTLAEAERFWEALKKWDEALALNPTDATLFEMKAQAYLHLCEVFPAVQSARTAVQLAPTWWEAYQTLGRSQLGLGEVKLALRSFSKAFHINPSDRELWEEDLQWSVSLLERKHCIKDKLESAVQQSKLTITTVEEDYDDNDSQFDSTNSAVSGTDSDSRLIPFTYDKTKSEEEKLNSLPGNYVQMRDSS